MGRVIGLAAILFVGLSNALLGSTLTYSYAGSCVQNCQDAELPFGSPTTASVTLDTSSYDPDGGFGLDALVDFDVSFEGQRFTKASTTFVSFGGVWEVIPGGPTIFLLGGSFSDGPSIGYQPTFDLSGDLNGGSARYSPRGFCESDPELGSCGVAFNGAAVYDVAPSPVPLPAAGWFLAAAFAALFWLRRGRSKPTAA